MCVCVCVGVCIEVILDYGTTIGINKQANEHRALILEVNQTATVMDVHAPASFTVCLPNWPEILVISYWATRSFQKSDFS